MYWFSSVQKSLYILIIFREVIDPQDGVVRLLVSHSLVELSIRFGRRRLVAIASGLTEILIFLQK